MILIRRQIDARCNLLGRKISGRLLTRISELHQAAGYGF
jgi:hypothetical protein